MAQKQNNTAALTSVTGVQLAQGMGVAPASGFWADAWSQVLTRRGAVGAIIWLSTLVFFAIFSPLLASGHPIVLRTLDASGAVTGTSWPLFENLAPVDLVLLAVGLVGGPYLLLGRGRNFGQRLGTLALATVASGIALLMISFVGPWVDGGNAPEFIRARRSGAAFPYVISGLVAAAVTLLLSLLPLMRSRGRQLSVLALVLVVTTLAAGLTWSRPIAIFPYQRMELAGEARATYTLIPFSPAQRYSELDRSKPGTKLGAALALPVDSAPAPRRFWLGTDALGQDVLSQLMHACRLSLSIGMVSTGISVMIGVTLGALAGYFGGWVDMLIQRVIEIFMAVPLLFLLIIASGVLPPEFRTTYVTMAIIGLFSWPSAARYTRAEFYKLRNQDFVQGAKAVGLPLQSILFRHMLPNGVTPVLVDASFAIAAAILAEATLSFLGLGPVDSASWGKVLSYAMSVEGDFRWWLAVFPGLAIFVTALSYNLLGEALRDAIDPKLKKARV